ncbi:hypothetical protein K4G53_05790 [Arthrobacter sp. MAHUQ-56]|nr:hypothetical protein [Arthrobacter sp. MAHUQ-56]
MCPLKLLSGVTISGLVKEPTTNLVPYQGFAGDRAGQTQGFLMQLRGFMPPVLPLISMCENEKGPEPVTAVSEQQPSFRNGFLFASKY